MNIRLNSVMVDDQEKAHRLCTGVPGCVKLKEIPVTTVAFEDTCGNIINLCQPE